MLLRHLAPAVALAMVTSLALGQGSQPATSAPGASNSSAPAAAAPTGYSTQTPLGTLLDDPAAKDVLTKYIPQIVNNPQIDQARSMTLKDIQQYAADQLTDQVLAQIDADLGKLSPKK